jgi:hypothetical protein
MAIELLQHWQIVADGLEIFLCLLILFFLMRNQRRKMKPDLKPAMSQSGPDFNFQVFMETIHQQVDLAFANIRQVAANERRNFDEVLRFQQQKYTETHSKEGFPPASFAHRIDTFQTMTEPARQGERQTRIQQLATRGMSAKQISDELKTPLGEVELVMSLQKRSIWCNNSFGRQSPKNEFDIP